MAQVRNNACPRIPGRVADDLRTRTWTVGVAVVAMLAGAVGTLAGCTVGPRYQGAPAVAPDAVKAPTFVRAPKDGRIENRTPGVRFSERAAGRPPAK